MSSNILLIDDETNVRKMIQLALTHEGYTVDSAEDGEIGLQIFGDGSKHDLVLLDQRLPGKPGIEVQEDLYKVAPEVKVIMITAYGSFDLALEAMQMGASDFLRKPFSIETLRNAVQAALDRPVKKHEAIPIGTVCQAFTRTTINGFSFVAEEEEHAAPDEDEDYKAHFKVKSPEGKGVHVEVVLPCYIQEFVKAKIDAEEVPSGNAFWQALCEEALADHLWQHAMVPEGNNLRIEDLSPNVDKWMDQMVTVQAGAN